MNKMLSREVMAIVKTTAPAFEAFGAEIAAATYERLMANPQARALFGEARLRENDRPAFLDTTMFEFAAHIDALDQIDGVIARVAQRHVDEGFRPGHYPYVVDALLPAIRDVLGEGATEEVLDAWREAFWHIAEIMIARETALYQKAGRRPEVKAA